MGVHLPHQPLQDRAPPTQEGDEPRGAPLPTPPHLRRPEVDPPLGAVHVRGLVAIALPAPLLAPLIPLSTQELPLLGFQQFLEHPLDAQPQEQATQLRLLADRCLPVHQLGQLLRDALRWWYPLHGVAVSLLPVRARFELSDRVPQRQFFYRSSRTSPGSCLVPLT